MDQEYFSCSSVVYLLMTTVNLSANEQFEILSSQICTLEIRQLNSILSSVNWGYFSFSFCSCSLLFQELTHGWPQLSVLIMNSLTPT